MKKYILECFYDQWSGKNIRELELDERSASRKCEVVTSIISSELRANISTVVDVGCGYGAFLRDFCVKNDVSRGVGLDYSEDAISFATKNNANEQVAFEKLENLSLDELKRKIDESFPSGIDAVLLIDLLEHVPDCSSLVRTLATKTNLFIVKLPVEASIFDNYVIPKERLGPNHSNGHLREFGVDGVLSFVSKLGLIPVAEKLYVYHVDDMIPPCQAGAPFYRRLVVFCLRTFKRVAKALLPVRIYMALVGGGGYVCVATFDEEMVLYP